VSCEDSQSISLSLLRGVGLRPAYGIADISATNSGTPERISRGVCLELIPGDKLSTWSRNVGFGLARGIALANSSRNPCLGVAFGPMLSKTSLGVRTGLALTDELPDLALKACLLFAASR